MKGEFLSQTQYFVFLQANLQVLNYNQLLQIIMEVMDLVRYNHVIRRLYFETKMKLPLVCVKGEFMTYCLGWLTKKSQIMSVAIEGHT